MATDQTHDITTLLHLAEKGDQAAAERLAEKILPELEKIATFFLRGENSGQTFEAHDLINDIYLKLQPGKKSYNDRVHFKAYAAKLMRWRLIERARKRAKRGQLVTLEDLPARDLASAAEISSQRAIELSRLDDALQRLRGFDERAELVVELKYFGGLTVREMATRLEVSESTVKLDWRTAHAFLKKELGAAGASFVQQSE
jgi:RNA polymerase sigma factor (TIGR02999 family)